jgi:hypothetical protein
VAAAQRPACVVPWCPLSMEHRLFKIMCCKIMRCRSCSLVALAPVHRTWLQLYLHYALSLALHCRGYHNSYHACGCMLKCELLSSGGVDAGCIRAC